MSAAATNSTRPERSPGLWAVLRGFPRPVWVLFLGTFINRFGTFVMPFLALHLTRIGYTSGEASLVLGAFGAGHLVASALGGHLADTLGRRKTIVISLLAGAAGMLLLSQATTLAGLVLCAFFTGLAGEFYRPAATALLADLVPPEHRLTAYAAFRFAVNAGWACGPAVAGLLAAHSYFWLFLGDAATSALYGLIAWLLLPSDADRSRGRWQAVLGAGASLAQASRVALRDGRFLRLILGTLATAFVFIQMFTILGLEMRVTGSTERAYGLILALNGVLIILFELPLSAVIRRLAPTRVIASGFALIGCGAGVFGWADSVTDYAIGMTLFTFGEMLSMPTALAYAANLAPDDMRGRYLGVYGLTFGAAFTFGPGLGMALFTLQPVALWMTCCGVGLLAAAVVARRSTRQVRATPATNEANAGVDPCPGSSLRLPARRGGIAYTP